MTSSPDQDPIEKIPRIREESLCPCKSKHPYKACCMPYHYGRANPETAEQLMRARYAAYFFRRLDFILDTTHPQSRSHAMEKQLRETIGEVNWSFLHILNTSKGGPGDKVGKVEFVAEYFIEDQAYDLHEHSRFKRYKGLWKYLDDKG